MGGFLGLLGILLALIWALRIESNTAATKESLLRIEKLLTDKADKKETK